MKLSSLLGWVLLALAGNLAAQTSTSPSPVQTPNDPKNFDLYLLVGQSNMAGRGVVTDADRVPDPHVWVLNKQDQWANQGEPIHFDRPQLIGVGLGFTFGKLMAAAKPGVTIGLIPCAVGGTSISQWKPGAELFVEAVRRAKIAQEKGTLKGILWHQGESDSGYPGRAAAYGKLLAEVATGFREALEAPDVPFIAGEIGDFLYTKPDPNYAHAREVNASIDSLPTLIPRAAVVSSAGLKDNGDQLHFDAASEKELGQRYFDAFQKLEASR